MPATEIPHFPTLDPLPPSQHTPLLNPSALSGPTSASGDLQQMLQEMYAHLASQIQELVENRTKDKQEMEQLRQKDEQAMEQLRQKIREERNSCDK